MAKPLSKSITKAKSRPTPSIKVWGDVSLVGFLFFVIFSRFLDFVPSGVPAYKGAKHNETHALPETVGELCANPKGSKNAGNHRGEVRGNGQYGHVTVNRAVRPCGIGKTGGKASD